MSFFSSKDPSKLSKMQLMEAYFDTNKFQSIVKEMSDKWKNALQAYPGKDWWSTEELSDTLSIDEKALTFIASRADLEMVNHGYSTNDINALIQKAKDKAKVA